LDERSAGRYCRRRLIHLRDAQLLETGTLNFNLRHAIQHAVFAVFIDLSHDGLVGLSIFSSKNELLENRMRRFGA
jgi:hypothetical protein